MEQLKDFLHQFIDPPIQISFGHIGSQIQSILIVQNGQIKEIGRINYNFIQNWKAFQDHFKLLAKRAELYRLGHLDTIPYLCNYHNDPYVFIGIQPPKYKFQVGQQLMITTPYQTFEGVLEEMEFEEQLCLLSVRPNNCTKDSPYDLYALYEQINGTFTDEFPEDYILPLTEVKIKILN